jgi:hypothetical protein
MSLVLRLGVPHLSYFFHYVVLVSKHHTMEACRDETLDEGEWLASRSDHGKVRAAI